MRRTHEVTIDAEPAVVWDVWRDVEAWPSFIDTVHELELLSAGLDVGARVRIRQPGLPADLWTVTSYDPGVGWIWQARGPGVTTTASHRLRSDGDGGTVATAEVTQDGIVGALVGWVFGGLVRRYIRAELAGVRSLAEARRAHEA